MLFHAENAEYLTGIKAIYGFPDFYDQLNKFIEQWNSKTGGFRNRRAPSIRILWRYDDDCWRCGYVDATEQTTLRVGVAPSEEISPSIIVVPMAFLSPDAGTLFGKHVVYAHWFGQQQDNQLDHTNRLTYVGVTRQGWVARWKQHLSAAMGGSRYLFHKAIRDYQEKKSTGSAAGLSGLQGHRVLHAGLPFEEAMEAEEAYVGRDTLYPNGLNMIPGGFAGMKYLAKLGGFAVTNKKWEYRHKVLKNFANHCRVKGIPNPLAAARWRDDEYAAKVILANPRNLKRIQIDEVRYLDSLGWSTVEIADHLAIRHERVCRLLVGKTYSRI